MEDAEVFLQTLKERLEKRRAYLDTARLPLVKEAFRSLQTLFESLLNMLLRKGLLREDPYKYDRQITEISVPPDEPLLEAEKRDEVSYRLSAYRGQLDYLNSSYQFSVSFLDLTRLKRISSLLGYIGWKSLADTARSPTTRAFAQYLGKIRMGTDAMATGIVKDSLVQVEKVLRVIHSGLAEVVSYHREAFKCELRSTALPRLDRAAAGKREDASRALKRAYAQAAPGQPYYPELAAEVLEEELAEDAAARRETLLELLAVREEKKEEPHEKQQPHKDILLETARILSRTAGDLSSALEALIGNSQVIGTRRQGLGERLRKWLSRGGRGEDDDQIFEVEYREGVGTAEKTERVSFRPFVETVKKKASLLSSLANRAGGTFQKLEATPEDQLLEFVSRQLADLHLIRRRLNGLHMCFLSEAPREARAQMRGIQRELAAIHSGIVTANQKKHDYVARREEEEQMRRLGIR